MSRPVTLFTGQWADLSLADLLPLVKKMGYDGVELACWGDHFEPDRALAEKLLPRGCGAVFSFNLKGTRAAGARFVEQLAVFSHLANVGDAKSLVIHPASTTHFRVPDAELAAAGITQGTIRLSIGLEDPADLIEDLGRALKAAAKAEK